MKYTFVSQRQPDIFKIELNYVKSRLRTIGLKFEQPTTEHQLQVVLKCLHDSYTQTEEELIGIGFERCAEELRVEKQKDENGQWKISMWLEAWKKHKHRRYHLNNAEAGALRKGMLLNREEFAQALEFYFTAEHWLCKDQNPRRFVQHQNNFIDLCKSSGFPSKYDAEYEKKLDTKTRAEYWKHLRALGFEAVKNAKGNIINWQRT